MKRATVRSPVRQVGGAHVLLCLSLLTASNPSVVEAQEHQHHHNASEGGVAWRMPPMNMMMPMLPGLEGKVPTVTPWLPGMGLDPGRVPEARFREVVELSDGDTLRLRAMRVRRTIGDRTFVMFGYNGQYPGPLLKADQGSTIVVVFENQLELPTTVHWHGVRLDNRFDGVPKVTQEPVEQGETFVYRVHFVDAGIYWYHPHVQENLQQDLGLYGNMLVSSPDPDYYGAANSEEVVMLDDLLLDAQGLMPWGLDGASHALMGRFGNIFLLNGSPDYRLRVRRGDVVRFYLTNVSNTRTFHLRFGNAPMKVLATGLGRFEQEWRVGGVVIAPAQRYVVDVYFPDSGTVPIINSVQAINHYLGRFYSEVDTLGLVEVAETPTTQDLSAAFRTEHDQPDARANIAKYSEWFDKPPDHRLEISVEIGDLPSSIMRMMAIDTLYFPPVEWNDAMPMMNWFATSNEVTWILRDPDTGAENMDIDWTFEEGEVAKIRIFNDPEAIHPMQHPIHLHGQRFLVLERDGVRNENMAWRDTAIVPVGSTVDILVDMSNPGEWMLHCHIAEHIDSGMMMTFTVQRDGSPTSGAAGSPGP